MTNSVSGGGAGLREIVAESLIAGLSIDDLMGSARCAEFDSDEVVRVAREVLNDPIMRIAALLASRVRKLEAFLRVAGTMQAARFTGTVPEADFLDADTFRTVYYAASAPVVLRGVAIDWPLMQVASWASLAERFGNVPVELSVGTSPRKPGAPKEHALLGEFIARVRSAGACDHFYLVANDRAMAQRGLRDLISGFGDVPAIPEFKTFASGANIWIGPRGATTSVHFDVANNLLIQVEGEKEVAMRSAFAFPLHYSVRAGLYADTDVPEMRAPESTTSAFGQSWEKTTLRPGDALFIPAGWSHYVYSLSAAVSFNVNFSLCGGDDQILEALHPSRRTASKQGAHEA
jgi:hypothetical protein